jgi:hypothetical protein
MPHPQWVSEYRIIHDVVRQVAGGVALPQTQIPKASSRYFPSTRTELPTEFSKLANASDQEILAFVTTYGFIGHDLAFSHEEQADLREARVYEPADGDPLPWIRQHASTVAFVMELLDAIDDRVRLSSIMDRLLNKDTLELTCRYAVRGRRQKTTAHYHGVYPCDYRRSERKIFSHHQHAARVLLAHIISDNLEGVSRRLELWDSQLTPVFRTRNLLEYIYLMLADAVAGGVLKRCNFCQRVFIAPHLKMKFCPPRLGAQGVSSCMNRYKQRRFQRKRRARDLRAGGTPIKQIADQLKETAAQVRQWLSTSRTRRVLQQPKKRHSQRGRRDIFQRARASSRPR